MSTSEPSKLHRIRVELRLPLRERGTEVEVAGARGHPRFVLALAAAGGGPPSRRRPARRSACVPPARALLALGLGGGVRGDPLHEPIRQPLAVGDVQVLAASVGAGQFEQAAERAGGVRVLVGESEALPLPSLLRLARLPLVLVAARDLRQFAVGGSHRLAVLAELGQDARQPLLLVAAAGKERPVPAADAVGDRVERLAVVVLPLGLEHVVHHLARRSREVPRPGRVLSEPRCRQVGE
jgi:hypothetical protein